ncbi:NDR1/HIN1-like protein 13 [Mercurialis annua]|uniref:NDR1/HIN1-like protein 13 n=1 Tax=Mercurialis annua TaxID=3986 RepID=UPI00215E72F8|nr:NDR1/HIN1-like protein 13 [Mercurialis annua]
MEERHSTFSVESTGDEPPLHQRPSSANYEPVFQPRPFPSRKSSIQDRSRTASIESETYVIQIPKEQIFSVPPPENAIIAERYRNPETKDNHRSKRLLCAIIALIVFAGIIGIGIGAFRILFNPEVPSFSIVNVHAKNKEANSPHHSKKKSNILYELKLQTNNKNKRLENIYDRNGHSTLLYKGVKIGTGKFPEFYQAADSSKKISLDLTSSNSPLPHDIEKSIGDKSGKRHVALSLKMNVPVKMKLWSKVVDVVCNFKVKSLGSTVLIIRKLWLQICGQIYIFYSYFCSPDNTKFFSGRIHSGISELAISKNFSCIIYMLKLCINQWGLFQVFQLMWLIVNGSLLVSVDS